MRRKVGELIQSKRERVIINVGYKINSVRDVDPKNATFKADFKIFYCTHSFPARRRAPAALVSRSARAPRPPADWNDPHFVGHIDEAVDITEPGAFNPDLQISNEEELTLNYRECRVKDPTVGRIKLSEYYRGTLSIVDMSLRHFPFDMQSLRVCVKPHKLTADEVELAPAGVHAIEHHTRLEWKVVGHCTHVYATNPARSTKHKVYSSLHIIVLVEREYAWYVWNIMVPNLLLVLLNMSVFFMRTDGIPERMETSVALVLASITLKFTVNEYTPKLPYPTLCDYFTWTCFYVQIVMGLSNPLIFQLRRYAGLRLLGRLHSAPTLANWVLCFACAATLAALIVWLKWQIYLHTEDVREWKAQALPADEDDTGVGGELFAINGVLTAVGKVADVLTRWPTTADESDGDGAGLNMAASIRRGSIFGSAQSSSRMTSQRTPFLGISRGNTSKIIRRPSISESAAGSRVTPLPGSLTTAKEHGSFMEERPASVVGARSASSAGSTSTPCSRRLQGEHHDA